MNAKERKKTYDASSRRRAYQKAYRDLPEAKARQKAYVALPEVKARMKATRDAPKRRAKQRDTRLRGRYGLSLVQLTTLLAAQGNRCAICGADAPRGRGAWHVDHNHATGKIRAILCNGCNTGLGLFGDDPIRLELAAAYLREHA